MNNVLAVNDGSGLVEWLALRDELVHCIFPLEYGLVSSSVLSLLLVSGVITLAMLYCYWLFGSIDITGAVLTIVCYLISIFLLTSSMRLQQEQVSHIEMLQTFASRSVAFGSDRNEGDEPVLSPRRSPRVAELGSSRVRIVDENCKPLIQACLDCAKYIEVNRPHSKSSSHESSSLQDS